jgi:hypothetical protein
MKAEHRKELQTNALADRIGRFFKGVRTKTQTNTLLVGVILLVGAAVIGGWIYFNRAAKKARSAMWVEVDSAAGQEQAADQEGNPPHSGQKNLDKAEEDLEQVIEKHKGTNAALMARFQLAQLNLRSRGIDMLGEFPGMLKVKPLASIKKAQEQYESLAEDCKDDPYWGPQALLGKAKCLETLAVEDLKNLDKAARVYRDLADNHGASAAGQAAKDRLAKFNDRSQRERIETFYTDLARDLMLRAR